MTTPVHDPVLLVVDDEPDNLLVMQAIISHYFPRCRVITARHGEEALRLMGETTPDGAIIDMQMPGLSGIDLCKQFKARSSFAQVPLLLMSAYPTTPATRAQGLRAGAVDFISKPINNEELAAKIGVMLREKEGSDRLRENNVQLESSLEKHVIALRESEARLRAVVENSPDVIISLDRSGHILYFNRHPQILPGIHLNTKADEWLPSAARPLFAQTMEDSLASGKPTEMEFQDAAGGDWLLRLAPTPQAETVGSMMILTDITQRKQAERILREAEERFRLVMDNLDAIVYVSDLESHELLFVNRLGKALFGPEVEGQPCWQVFYDGQGPCPICARVRKDYRKIPASLIPPYWERHLKNQRWYTLRYTITHWLNGREAVVVVATDITERKAMEENLRHAQRMEAVGTLTSGISHDFNNILGILLGNLQLASLALAKDPTFAGSEAADCLEQAQIACQRGRDVAQQLLAFSRPATGKKERILLTTLVQETLLLLKPSFYQQIRIVTDFAEVPLVVEGDATQLSQVMVNLCTNASQAMGRQAGQLEIALYPTRLEDAQAAALHLQPGTYAVLAVRDTGGGIPPAILPRIFDPFFTTKEAGNGSGLGLAMVHGIVTHHAGAIQVENRFGTGCCFRVLLPTVAADASDFPGSGDR